MSQDIELIPTSFDYPAATCSFATCQLPTQRWAGCLIVSFAGIAGNARDHIGMFRYMKAMIAAGVAAWDPIGVVLNLTDVWYEWGEGMADVLHVARLPTAVVVSDRNRAGMTSLIEAELREGA